MLTNTIKYKVEQIGGVFIEVPTRKVKPSQTCPKCGNKHKKTLDIRVHECLVCGYLQDRDIAALCRFKTLQSIAVKCLTLYNLSTTSLG